MDRNYIGTGKVVLLASAGKCFTDIAARFVGSDRSLEDIAGSEYDKNIVRNILSSGHMAATEFDTYIFGFEGFSRVFETQLVRKRHASFMIQSGRIASEGEMSVVYPQTLNTVTSNYSVWPSDIILPGGVKLSELCPDIKGKVSISFDTEDMLLMNEAFLDSAKEQGIKPEDVRYLSMQATSIKGIMAMNAHGAYDYFKIRTCRNAQPEHRDFALKMMALLKADRPDLFKDAGPSCHMLGYCPEKWHRDKKCDNVISKEEAIAVLRKRQRLKDGILNG